MVRSLNQLAAFQSTHVHSAVIQYRILVLPIKCAKSKLVQNRSTVPPKKIIDMASDNHRSKLPPLSTSIMFETSTNLLESVDLLLSGRPDRGVGQQPNQAPSSAGGWGALRSDTDNDLAAASDAFLFGPGDRSKPRQRTRSGSSSITSSQSHGLLPQLKHDGINTGHGFSQSKQVRQQPALLGQDLESHTSVRSSGSRRSSGWKPVPKVQLHEDESPPLPRTPDVLVRRNTTANTLRHQEFQSEHSGVSSPHTSQATQPVVSPKATHSTQAPQNVTLDKGTIAELVTTIRETVKAEIEENLTDLRNDILNIHSEIVVMTSQHSEELRKVIVDRDEGIARLQEENEKLRTENDNLKQKYGLFSQ